jgi:ribosomal protein S18 acetylase RimI-like enzyme
VRPDPSTENQELAVSTEALSFADFDDPPKAGVLAVDSGLDHYNRAAAPLSDVRPLASLASGPSGQIVGGAVGRTWGRCCELLQLWVDPTFRTQGVATRLLRQFEQRAASRGCDVYYLTTLSFQAPGFYLKRGYASIAEISGYPDGITKYLMYKETLVSSRQGGLT